MNNHKDNPTRGFTLIELMMVIAIMGITIAFAVPSFQSLIASSRLTTSANNLVSALQLARSEAIKSNYLVVVSRNACRTSTADPTDPDCWGGGWVVFADVNQDDAQAIDGTEPTIGNFDALNADVGVNASLPFTNRVTYRPDGRSTTAGNFYFCSPADITNFRRVVISATGRVRIETPTTAAANGTCP